MLASTLAAIDIPSVQGQQPNAVGSDEGSARSEYAPSELETADNFDEETEVIDDDEVTDFEQQFEEYAKQQQANNFKNAPSAGEKTETTPDGKAANPAKKKRWIPNSVKAKIRSLATTVFLLMFLAIFVLALPLPICAIESDNEQKTTGKLETWKYLNCVYYCTVTLTTIGYGDISPKTTWGRIYMMGYIILGLATVGATITMIGNTVVQSAETTIVTVLNFFKKCISRLIRKNDADIPPKLKSLLDFVFGPSMKTAFLFLVLIVHCIIGASVFHAFEGKYGRSFFDMLYFSFVTVTTIGYGDIVLQEDGSKIFCIFFAILGIALIGILLGFIGEFMLSRWKTVNNVVLSKGEYLARQMKKRGRAAAKKVKKRARKARQVLRNTMSEVQDEVKRGRRLSVALTTKLSKALIHLDDKLDDSPSAGREGYATPGLAALAAMAQAQQAQLMANQQNHQTNNSSKTETPGSKPTSRRPSTHGESHISHIATAISEKYKSAHYKVALEVNSGNEDKANMKSSKSMPEIAVHVPTETPTSTSSDKKLIHHHANSDVVTMDVSPSPVTHISPSPQ